MSRAASAVIWDFEGTLARRVRSDLEIAAEELARLGVELSSLRPSALADAQAWYQSTSRGWRTVDQESDGYVQLVRRLLAAAGRSSHLPRDHISKQVRSGFGAYQLVPGIDDVLRAVQHTGARQAVVSNWLPSLPDVLGSLSVGAFFEVVVISAVEGVYKPDPRLLGRALDRLAVTPLHAIVVGDDPASDLAPATALGCTAVHFDPLSGQSEGIHSAADLLEHLLTLLMP